MRKPSRSADCERSSGLWPWAFLFWQAVKASSTMTELPEAAHATANGSLAEADKPAKKLSATEKRKLREKQKKAEKRRERFVTVERRLLA